MEHLENHMVCQIGIVVRDVEATAEKLSQMFGEIGRASCRETV